MSYKLLFGHLPNSKGAYFSSLARVHILGSEWLVVPITRFASGISKRSCL